MNWNNGLKFGLTALLGGIVLDLKTWRASGEAFSWRVALQAWAITFVVGFLAGALELPDMLREVIG